MQIQKIFSDVDGDERLYSVLMNEEELKMFGDVQKDHSLIKGLSIAGSGATLGAVGIGDNILGNISDYFLKKSKRLEKKAKSDPELQKESEKLLQELKKMAEKQGIKIMNDPDFGNAAFLGGESWESSRTYFVHKIKSKLKKCKTPEERKQVIEKFLKDLENYKIQTWNNVGSKKIAHNFGKQVIMTGTLNDASTVAHELGHAQYAKNRSKDIIGKIGHKAYVLGDIFQGPNYSQVLNNYKNLAESIGEHPELDEEAGKIVAKALKGSTYIPSALLLGGGFRRGKNSVKTNKEGNIEINNKKLLKSLGIGTALASPVLLAEGAASRQGLRMLRKAGASKKYMKEARKFLGSAYGTYVPHCLTPVLQEVSGHQLGTAYGIGREKVKQRKKKINENTENI